MDLDLGFSLGILDKNAYQAISARLREAGLSPDTNERNRPTSQRWAIRDPVTVTIDFLIAPTAGADEGGKLRNLEPDFAAIVTRGLPLAFTASCVRASFLNVSPLSEVYSRIRLHAMNLHALYEVLKYLDVGGKFNFAIRTAHVFPETITAKGARDREAGRARATGHQQRSKQTRSCRNSGARSAPLVQVKVLSTRNKAKTAGSLSGSNTSPHISPARSTSPWVPSLNRSHTRCPP